MLNYNFYKDLPEDKLLTLARELIDQKKLLDALSVINQALLNNPDSAEALFVAGKAFVESNRECIAEPLYRWAAEKDPARAETVSSIGRSIDAPSRPEEAIGYIKTAITMNPENKISWINLSSAYSQTAQYDKSKLAAEKVLEFDPNSKAGHDNLGIACLGLGEWGKGWDGCDYGLGGKYRLFVQYGDEPEWKGEKDQTVIVYTEQGLGDEILYGSCLPDIIRDSKRVIIDCDPKMESLFKRSFPEATVYGTRKQAANWPHNEEWDSSVALATLPKFYRREEKDFPGKPFLKADPVRTKQWKVILDEISTRPKIGIAWSGGGQWTNRKNRTIDPSVFLPLAEIGDLINLEYDRTDDKECGFYQWDHATLTENYDDTVGLISALDYVVTVPTAVVHAAGGLGVPCHVILNDMPTWRYARERMPWYNSVRLHHFDESYDNSIQSVIEEIENGTIKSVRGF